MTVGLDTVRLSAQYAPRPGDASSARGGAAQSDSRSGRAVARNQAAEHSGSVGEGRCRTCAERKYKDVSDDPSVSFQTPTSVAPGQAAAAVSAHERQHVRNNAERAEQEGMTATSTVVLHSDVCPECGRVYVSGGTTTTTYSRSASAFGDNAEKGLFVDATA